MKKPSKTDFIRRIERCKKEIERATGELCDIRDEIEGVIGSSDEAIRDLDSATAALRQYL